MSPYSVYSEMKNSDIEWVGDVPCHWSMRTLYQLASQVKNKNADLQEQNLLSLSYGKIKRRDINSSDGLLPESFDGYNIIEKGDIVLRLTDLQNDKTSLRVGLASERGIVTSAYITIRPFDTAQSTYLYYMLHAFDIKKGFYGMGAGVRQGLNYGEVKELRLVLPAQTEMDKIVLYLDKQRDIIDAIISDAKVNIHEYAKWRASIIYETVMTGINAKAKTKDCGIDWIGIIPEHWQILKGKHIFVQRNSKGNTKELQLLSPTQRYGVIPQKKLEEMTGSRVVKVADGTDLSKFKSIYRGDFCISLRSFQGGFEYSLYDGVVSPAYQVFYSTIEICDRYYKYLFKDKTFIDKMNSYTLTLRDGKMISFSDFANTHIPVPPLSEQIEIADYLDEQCRLIEEIVSIKGFLIDNLEAYKQSLIYEVVTGKRKVV